MKRAVVIGFLILASSIVSAPSAGAEALKIAPLKYEATLAVGESKKGFVDVSNPTYEPVTVNLSVQAFRQIDDDGTLEYYDSEQISAGVLLDLTEIELKPRGAMRVYFLLDSSKLPSGDVFAAIFASTVPTDKRGARQSVQVGTLLLLTNGTPSSHQADVTDITGAWVQIGDGLTATITVHNPAPEDLATGFFPEITVKTQPYSETTVQGPLLFAGRTRVVEYRQPGNYFGLIRIVADAGGEQGTKWAFVVTGYWRWLAPLIVGVLVGMLAIMHRYWRRERSKSSRRSSRR